MVDQAYTWRNEGFSSRLACFQKLLYGMFKRLDWDVVMSVCGKSNLLNGVWSTDRLRIHVLRIHLC